MNDVRSIFRGRVIHLCLEQVDLPNGSHDLPVGLLVEGMPQQDVDQAGEGEQHDGQAERVPQGQAPADAEGHGSSRRL